MQLGGPKILFNFDIDKQYKCPIDGCCYKSKRSSDVVRHMKIKHKDDYRCDNYFKIHKFWTSLDEDGKTVLRYLKEAITSRKAAQEAFQNVQ